MNIDNPLKKQAGLTLLFYVGAALAIFILDKIVPSELCGPGLGILSFMLLPFVSSILLVKNFIRTYKGDQKSRFPLLIHFLFIIGFIIYLKAV